MCKTYFWYIIQSQEFGVRKFRGGADDSYYLLKQNIHKKKKKFQRDLLCTWSTDCVVGEEVGDSDFLATSDSTAEFWDLTALLFWFESEEGCLPDCPCPWVKLKSEKLQVYSKKILLQWHTMIVIYGRLADVNCYVIKRHY